MEHFLLEKDAPGILVSFQIPSVVIADKLSRGETIAINYRHLYKRLTGRKRSAAALAVSSLVVNDKTSISLTSSVATAGSRHMMRSSNTFENVIDKLERKYYVNAPIDEGDSNSSGTRSTTTGTPNSHAAATPATETEPAVESIEEGGNNGEVRLKRKKKVVNDTYDYSDPFLDDSETVKEYEGRLMAKRRKNGSNIQYMVSAGNVEGDEEELMDEEDQVDMDESPSTTTADAIVKVIKPPKSAPSSSSNTAAAMTSATKPPNASITSASAASTSASGLPASSPTAAKPKQPPVPKPLWSPAPAILTAMKQFKDASAVFNNIGKNAGLPISLEGPLLHLDRVVTRHYTAKELAKVSGYFEFIQSCLGGAQFPIGRVKAALSRLYARETAQKANEKLNGLIETFKADIIANIRPCPEEKQPSFKTDSVSVSTEDGDDLAMLPLSTSASSTRYAYQFVWTTPFREKLLAIRTTAGEWLSLENAYRSKLTNLDKKGLDPKKTALLDPTLKMIRILGEICDAFPASCLHGDIAAMSRVLGIDELQNTYTPVTV